MRQRVVNIIYSDPDWAIRNLPVAHRLLINCPRRFLGDMQIRIHHIRKLREARIWGSLLNPKFSLKAENQDPAWLQDP